MEETSNLELGIGYIEMQNGEIVQTKREYQTYLKRNIFPRLIILLGGEKLTIDDYLELLELSKVSTNSQERNVASTSTDTNMTPDEIEALLLGISPEKWVNATEEQKEILINTYRETMSNEPARKR